MAWLFIITRFFLEYVGMHAMLDARVRVRNVIAVVVTMNIMAIKSGIIVGHGFLVHGNVLSSDGQRAKFFGTGRCGHGVFGHGRARAMPLFKLFGTGTNHRAMGTKRA